MSSGPGDQESVGDACDRFRSSSGIFGNGIIEASG